MATAPVLPRLGALTRPWPMLFVKVELLIITSMELKMSKTASEKLLRGGGGGGVGHGVMQRHVMKNTTYCAPYN